MIFLATRNWRNWNLALNKRWLPLNARRGRGWFFQVSSFAANCAVIKVKSLRLKNLKTFWDLFWHIHLRPKKRNGWVLGNPEIDSLRIAAKRLNPTKEMTFCQRSRRWKVSYAKWARWDGGIGSPPRLKIVELWYQSKDACPSRFLWHGQRRIYPTWISKCVFMMAWHFSTNLSWPDYDFSWNPSWTMKKLVLFIWISSESTPKLWSGKPLCWRFVDDHRWSMGTRLMLYWWWDPAANF